MTVALRNELGVAGPETQNDGGTANRLKVTARTNHGSIYAFRAVAPQPPRTS